MSRPEPVATRPQDYRIDPYAQFPHSVAEHLKAPEPFLLGHSHGGFVAQRYVLTPTALKGLILYDTSPRSGEEF
ncbi:alpha/beta fold hydrolase [Streptosporangium sp. NBC_01810]|uniref:alpha/beta fold hydrolase n=1 Tax=Streptosporangium sp. NBC_01810 TaxID=2975951 RepID=UPI003FA36BF7